MPCKPRLEIEYCTQCRWLLRAAWMAQELVTTFEKELGEVALIPGAGGIFEVRLEGKLIFSREQQRRFPESKELKQLLRDRIAPDTDLGYSGRCNCAVRLCTDREKVGFLACSFCFGDSYFRPSSTVS